MQQLDSLARLLLSGRLIDVTQTLSDGDRGVTFETACTLQRDGWNARRLHLYSHAGTHMDAVTHFFEDDEVIDGRPAGSMTIDRLPLQSCFSAAWVVDIDALNPGDQIELDDVRPQVPMLVSGESLILRTGWSQYAGQPEIYRDGLPRLSAELANWIASAGVRMLGVEPPSVADVNNLAEVRSIHRTLLRAGVTIVEGLTNLQQITQRHVVFAALPLKIAHGDGCPCRAFVVETSEAATDAERRL